MFEKLYSQEKIAKGLDSKVSSYQFLFSRKKILKTYEQLHLPAAIFTPFHHPIFNLNEVFKKIREYKNDTKKVIDLIKKNPERFTDSMQIEGANYDIQFLVLPQGRTTINRKGIICTKGQKFISGPNLMSLLRKSSDTIESLGNNSEYDFHISEDVIKELKR